MKKISLKNQSSFEGQPLTRKQLKNVMGGSNTATATCLDASGNCMIRAICIKPDGMEGRCFDGGNGCTCSSVI
ncbi:hypothetical protein DBR43_15295 [Pedobacter sp. KBW06]|uniref:hypothetical protein n=1 Tax=Pedobacter sp. KBW06 TaxID=2153359 RepID=UPI000F5A58C7|nr:hypothetical protein [Pedobacter sp. KBW06]RQO69444.1 hypothetical protein DBR43_15295 [Pedobacter sp. KBW06]